MMMSDEEMMGKVDNEMKGNKKGKGKKKDKGRGEHENHVKLRLTVKDMIEKYMYPSAIFFASKLSMGDDDRFTFGLTQFMGHHYSDAIDVILKRYKRPVRYRYLHAKCHAELGEWDKCLEVLKDVLLSRDGQLIYPQDIKDMDNVVVEGVDYPKISMISAMCCLKGQANRELGNYSVAKTWYEAALNADFWCYEAVVSLTAMLLPKQQVELLSPLLRRSIMHGWPLPLYSSLIKKNIVDDFCNPTPFFAMAATDIIWDLENVPVRHNLNFTIGRMLQRLAGLGYTGLVNITVVIGLESNVPAEVVEELKEAKKLGAIGFINVNSDVKQASDEEIGNLLDQWSEENEDPSNLWIVAGDGDYHERLRKLHHLHHNITIVSRSDSIAKKMEGIGYAHWDWYGDLVADLMEE